MATYFGSMMRLGAINIASQLHLFNNLPSSLQEFVQVLQVNSERRKDILKRLLDFLVADDVLGLSNGVYTTTSHAAPYRNDVSRRRYQGFFERLLGTVFHRMETTPLDRLFLDEHFRKERIDLLINVHGQLDQLKEAQGDIEQMLILCTMHMALTIDLHGPQSWADKIRDDVAMAPLQGAPPCRRALLETMKMSHSDKSLFQLMFNEVMGPMTTFVSRFWSDLKSDCPSHTYNPATCHQRRQGVTFFQLLSEDQARNRRFVDGMRAMEDLHPTQLPEVAEAYARFKQSPQGMFLVDVGGSDGKFVSRFLANNPQIDPCHTMVQDLLVEPARSNSDLPRSVHCMQHDFFAGQTVSACLYTLRACIHDYDDTEARIIIQNIASAMSPGSRLVLSENVASLHGKAYKTHVMDLCLMMFGGRVRSETQFCELLSSCGLELLAIHLSAKPPWCNVEAVKARPIGSAYPVD